MAQDESLFRLEVLCKSRHLGDILASLSGKAVQVSTPQLVANAQAGNGKLKVGPDRMLELFAVYLGDKKLTKAKLNAQSMRDFLIAIGYSPGAYSYHLRAAVDNGLLRKRGEGTQSTYTVNEAKVAKIAAAVKAQQKELDAHGSE